MIKSKKRGSIIVMSGTTCAGKGTVIEKLLETEKNLKLSISYTSREKRVGEINGVNYYFVTREEFEKKIEKGDFLEYAKVHDNYYGTPKAEIKEELNKGNDVILEIDVVGAMHVKKMFPEVILIFIMAPSMEVVRDRIKARGKETPEQIIRRFQTAYQEINEIPKYNYVVVNDVLEEAVNKVKAILLSEKCRVDRIEEILVSNQEEVIHEFLMDKEFDNSEREF